MRYTYHNKIIRIQNDRGVEESVRALAPLEEGWVFESQPRQT